MTTLVLVLRSFENKVFVLSCLSYTATLLKATSPRHSGPWLHWTVEWPFTSLHLRRWPTATCHLPPADELESVGAQPGESKWRFEVRWDQQAKIKIEKDQERQWTLSMHCSYCSLCVILIRLRVKVSSLRYARSSALTRLKCLKNSQRSLTWKHTRTY